VAGNFADDDNQASLEYAIQHFKPTPAIIVVMGHERCGAVKAAIAEYDKEIIEPEEEPVDPHAAEDHTAHPESSERLKALVGRLEQVVLDTNSMREPTEYGLRWDDAVIQNVRANVAVLQENSVIKEYIKNIGVTQLE
jgi:carbonic anhydrase